MDIEPTAAGIRKIRMIIAYEGTRYAGWQIQPHDRTIQGLLNEAASQILGHEVRSQGASRTDAGVHARHQVATIQTRSTLRIDKIRLGLNAILPPDIRIMSARPVSHDFDPRRDAAYKIYRYRMFLGLTMPPFERCYAAHIRGGVNIQHMREAAAFIVGTHDFAAFRDARCSARTTVRSISQSEFNILNDGVLEYIICGNGFLHHMVRIIAGTLVWIGRGKQSPSFVQALFDRRERRLAGPTAPAEGLFLDYIHFKED